MKPLDEIVERLTAHIRSDPSGARSLAHVLVLVPTAQSGRRLRLALANRLGALVPPTVRMAAQMFGNVGNVGSVGNVEVAGRSDEILAFHEALGAESSLDLAAQFSDIRSILGARALTFADVADKIGDILTDELADVEIERWQGLAEIEKRYLAALEKKGKTDRIVRMKETLADPPHLVGIETVVLAYLLDPLPAVRDLLAKISLRDKIEVEEIGPQSCRRGVLTASPEEKVPFPDAEGTPRLRIFPCATAASEAEKVAEIFASVKPDEALPALCIADAEEFPEIQGAMQARGLKVHNPSRTPLATSSLGHLVAQIAALVRTRSYNVFSAFIRGGDVRRWLCSELKLTDVEYVAALLDLDHTQTRLLPSTIDDIQSKTRGKLRAIFEHVDVSLRKRGIRQILQAVFAEHLLDERDPDAREFAAAAELVNSLIDECLSSRSTSDLDLDLFRLRLNESSYSLEPDEGDVVLTDGWLELPFLEADELIVTGFNEGRVPESVVGHAFLPDRLRRGLGLPDNESRLNRDRTILQLATGCRAPGAVKVFFRAMDAKGDVLKPSRLLFDGTDDLEFLDRANRFYGVRAGTEEARPADLPDAWRLKLEIPPERKELSFTSPSSLDLYLHCPFTYCLKKTFGEKEDDWADELDPSEFGNLIHDALELWGAGDLHDSEDAEAIAAELAAHVEAILGERFGTSVPAIVALQGESVKRRLSAFAKIQVAWHKEGWRTVAAERKLKVVYGHTTINGRCDRIDFNAKTGEWCVIDYKTFDNPERAVARDRKSGEWKSLQLPLYCAMLDADPEFPEAKREKISSVYCVLGKTDETTLFTEPMNGELVPEAEKKVRELIDRIERGIFWPPSPKNEWRWDFEDWIFNTPEESVDPAWLADQLKRIS